MYHENEGPLGIYNVGLMSFHRFKSPITYLHRVLMLGSIELS